MRERESLERDLMEYERIHKVQAGIISPTKLRMKLIRPHHGRKKEGSNSNSSRTSPSKLEDSEFVKNGLLASKNGDFDEEAPSLDVPSANLPGEAVPDSGQDDRDSSRAKDLLPRKNGEMGHAKMQQFSRPDTGKLSTIHPVRNLEDENLDYDSNASSSSFEFHKAERSLHNPRSMSRPMPSKWNDAEKWIINKHNAQSYSTKKGFAQGPAGRLPVTNPVKVTPESGSYDQRLLGNRLADTKRADFCQPASQMGMEKFSFVPAGIHPILCQANGSNAFSDLCAESKDLKEVGHIEISFTKTTSEDTRAPPTIRSVAMRDTGTEMTPVASQEPSRTATPLGATPFRSPTSSIPSTPRGRAPAPTPMEHTTDDEFKRPIENRKRELSEQELKEKTRKEIVALGVQLGKTNIAAWASKDEQEKMTSVKTFNIDEVDRIENEKRATAWEEAEKSKHLARYKREEIKIQAWESQQEAKVQAEMRRIESNSAKV
ncbi:uncharacterized protein LOC131144938 isoform X2 [Malania oleifera]|uniref:uncharacterized protein LOC131144938 isoform X2 n=1 Tax=Malania oleifera TaxID=397392 RepID=UPI0025AEBA20|nr:uncharacterized protein LOC131144938 isoform X2 [Malania oleifera]